MHTMNNLNTQSETLKLTSALLMYKGNSHAYCSQHEITEVGGVPMIGAGKGITYQALESVIGELYKSSQRNGFIDERMIFTSPSTTAWWMPSCQKEMFFKTNEVAFSGLSIQPNLLFVVKNENLYVFAIEGDERPNKHTELFNAPYWNVFSSGRLCTGNVKLPDEVNADNLMDWENIFFHSTFTHSNHSALLKDEEDYLNFWKLRMGTKNAFPSKKLHSFGKTILEFLDNDE